MADYIIKNTTLTAIADAIRGATGTSAAIKGEAFAESITYLNDFLNIVSRPSTFTVFSNPLVKKVGTNLLRANSRITEINLPNCDAIDTYACYEMSNLMSVSLPICSSFGQGTFALCSNLSNITLPSATYIGHQAFEGCVNLTNLTLPGSTIANLGGINAFYSTPMSLSSYTGSFGSIYVPYSLVDTYKSAVNWATYADRITAIQSNDIILEWIPANNGYSDKQEIEGSLVGDNNEILIKFLKERGAAPKYYKSDSALRVYKYNKITFTSSTPGYLISEIIITSPNTHYFQDRDVSVDSGNYIINTSDYTLTWTGAAEAVSLDLLNISATQKRISKIQIKLTK